MNEEKVMMIDTFGNFWYIRQRSYAVIYYRGEIGTHKQHHTYGTVYGLDSDTHVFVFEESN